MSSHQTRYRVIYGDTDRMGIAYHANYLRWFEIGRSEMFRDLGMPYAEIERRGIFLPVSEAFCKFRSPAHYDELIIIETVLDPAIRAGMKLDYTLTAEADRRALARGYTRHAFVDADGRVVRPPLFLTEIIRTARE